MAGAPANTVAPAVTSDDAGDYYTGRLLTTTNGAWTGSPTGYTYQWQRDTVNISGATSQTYTLVAADEGTSIRCVVTATNAGGSTAANSNAVSATDIMTHLFTTDGLDGALFDFTDNTTLWQDTGGSTAVTLNNDPVARADDLSGNGHNLLQATTTKRYIWKSAGHIDGDLVNDALELTVPTGGWAGTLVIHSLGGALAYDFASLPAGTYRALFSDNAFYMITGDDMLGFFIVDETLTANKLAAVQAYLETMTGTASAPNTSFSSDAMRSLTTSDVGYYCTKLRTTDFTGVTSVFRFHDAGYGTNLLANVDGFTGKGSCAFAFQGSAFASVTGMNLAAATDLWGAFMNVTELTNTDGWTWPTGSYSARWLFQGLLNMTTGPDTDIGQATNLESAFRDYGGSTFPAGVFDNVSSSADCTNLFSNAALDAAGVNNVLVSLDTAGLASVTIDIAGSNAAPTGAGLIAKVNLQGRGCTVNTN